jgi:nitroimidazol reductase NimA-like FMN-containing flavoprotein (pyridoxamine 5'-phosphate oxidase superfamily)
VAWDRNGLEILARQQCFDLLARPAIGRIALSVGALPVVLPVNFALFDGDVLIRTGPGSKLRAAATNAVVAFEVDEVDPIYHTGWSVLVQGVASEITDEATLARASLVPLVPWAGQDGRYLRIASQVVSGRRLTSMSAVTGMSSWPVALT